MTLDFLRDDLNLFIKNTIKPKYETFDSAHNVEHFEFVTTNCVNYAQALIDKGEKIDLEIAYTVGALHDIGIENGREGHAQSSGDFVRNCADLHKFFNTETIELIAQAVEDHSSHLEYEPRNIYGKIVADADRNNSLYLVFSRPVKYGIKHEAHLSKAEQIDRVYKFVQNKFGRNGYVKYWLNIPETTKAQNEVWTLLDDEKSCKAYISRLVDEFTNGNLK